jgi:predicted ATPase
MEIELELLTTTHQCLYALLLERTETDTLLIGREASERFVLAGAGSPVEINERPPPEPGKRRRPREYDLFASFRHYHFVDTSALRAECDLHENQQLREDGANLAALLYMMERQHPAAYRRITAAIRQVFAEFGGFVLAPAALNPERIRLRWRRKGVDGDFGANQLSDGTQRFMLLTTLLQQPQELLPAVLAIDEPELGLHPAALNLIGGLVASAAQHTQLIVATQSAALVDCFAPEEVIVVNRRDGASTFERLREEALAEWLRDYSLGQLWEKNVIGGGPFG